MPKITLNSQFIVSSTKFAVAVYFFVYLVSVIWDRDFIFYKFTEAVRIGISILIFLGFLGCVGILKQQTSKISLAYLWGLLVVLNFLRYSLFQLHHAYMGLMFLLLILTPNKPEEDEDSQQLFQLIQLLLLGLVSLNYSISGLAKLFFPGWISGEVSNWLLQHYVLRPEFEYVFSEMMKSNGRLFSLSILSIEIVPFFLFLLNSTRKYAWAAGVALQILLLVSCQLGQISLYMLIVHLFTFQPNWLTSIRQLKPR